MAEPTTAHDAGAVCTSCGLCCGGLLFAHVSVKADDMAARLRLGIDTNERGKVQIAHPCPHLDGTRCGTYADRPANCRDFHCGLRRSVLNGETSKSEADALVAEVKAELAALEPLVRAKTGKGLAEQGFRQFNMAYAGDLRRRVAGEGDAPDDVDRDLAARTFELLKIVDRRFRKTSRLGAFADLVLAVDEAGDDGD